MRDGRASRTAGHNALFRALERDDPYVARFLTGGFRLIAALARFAPWRRFAARVIDRGWPGVRATVIARTRLIDGWVRDLVADVDQAVILGAGFDTRAYRLAELRGLPVFEVDHPATQRRKLSRLGVRRENVRYVPTDFNVGGLGPALAEAGYRPADRTLFLWEGVTNYLTETAVDATLRWIAEAAPGSHLVMTYIDRRFLTHPEEYHGSERVIATVGRAGEPMTFGLPPTELRQYLSDRGLELVSDVGAAEFRDPGVRGHEFYRVAHAQVVS